MIDIDKEAEAWLRARKADENPDFTARIIATSSAISLKRIADALQPEITSSPSGTDPAGWLDWAGGPNPFLTDATVQVRLRSGEEAQWKADMFRWQHHRDDAKNDIVAYRVVSGGLPGKQTSPEIASIAARFMDISGENITSMGSVTAHDMAADIRRLAASALGQVNE